MLSWCNTRRTAVLCGVGGVLLVALLVHAVAGRGDAVKKAAKPLSIPHAAKPEVAQAPPPVVPPPVPTYTPLPPATAPMPPSAFVPSPTPPAMDFSAKTIDQLLSDLDEMRARKDAMDQQEKKVLALLRQKLADQEERLRKHGLTPEGAPACCNAGNGVPVGSVPYASR